MKLSRFRPAIIALLCSSSAGILQADVVVLKDGKRLEGSITAENPTVIHMKYKLTAKIWDDKDIPRTDIAEIIKQSPQEVELIELRKLTPTPDLMTAEKYEHIIQDQLRPFVNRYPGTKEAGEVEKMIDQLQGEKEKVVAGGTKMEGKWLLPDEAKAQDYNLKAYQIYSALHEKAVAKDYIGALREFDKLAPSQGMGGYGGGSAGYTASIYYPKAVEEAIAVLVNYEAQIEQMIKDQPALQKMRDDGLKKLVEPDLTRTKNAISREREQWKTTSDLERRSGKWFAPYKYDLPSLKSLSTTIVTEKTHLKGIDTAKIGKINESIAKVMVANAKASKNAESLNAMRDAIFEGEAGLAGLDQQMQMFYQPIFQGYRGWYMSAHQQLTHQSVQSAMAPAAGAPGGSTAIGGAPTGPSVDDRVAAALAAAAGNPAPAPAGQAPAPGQMGGAPAGVAPVQGAAAGYPPQQGVAPVAGQPPAGYPAQQGVAPVAGQQPGYPQQQPMQAPVPAVAATPVAEEGGIGGLSTNTLIFIGIGVVVLVLVVAMSGGKKKKA